MFKFTQKYMPAAVRIRDVQGLVQQLSNTACLTLTNLRLLYVKAVPSASDCGILYAGSLSMCEESLNQCEVCKQP